MGKAGVRTRQSAAAAAQLIAWCTGFPRSDGCSVRDTLILARAAAVCLRRCAPGRARLSPASGANYGDTHDSQQYRFVQRGTEITTAHDILRFKGATVHAVSATDTVLAALGVMAQHDIGAVLVFDGDKSPASSTERDYARKVVLAGRSSKDSPVGAIMTADVVSVPPNRSVGDCMTLMTNGACATCPSSTRPRHRRRLDRRLSQGHDRRAGIHH